MNTLGRLLRLTTFGESHGPAMGGILDGLPSGIRIDMADVQHMIDRRRTGRSTLTSQRRETDIPEILSGVNADGITLGTPIGFIFRNTDARSSDYCELEHRYRPGHADYTYDMKYGLRDPRGGGRASARETVNWVMGGALTMQWLRTMGISIEARLTAVGKAGYPSPLAAIMSDPLHGALPFDEATEQAMLGEVERARRDCDSVGGRVSCVMRGLPAGLGDPVFGKLQARLAEAMMSLNAVKGFEYGMGAAAAEARGSESIDLFAPGFSPAPMHTDRHGGALGGISTGMPVCFNLWFKPTPTISRPLPMPDREGEMLEVTAHGRHDPCVAMRSPVIVEALAALVAGDLLRF
ncbi:MAG: chorismate synthase [Muribaculaceae bacterium]|nr:chorismate synthase [Muribaculaceae bacterium]